MLAACLQRGMVTCFWRAPQHAAQLLLPSFCWSSRGSERSYTSPQGSSQKKPTQPPHKASETLSLTKRFPRFLLQHAMLRPPSSPGPG